MKGILLTITLTMMFFVSCGIDLNGKRDHIGEKGFDCYSDRSCNNQLICNKSNICEEDGNNDNIGKEGYSCFSNNTCNSGLICENNICKQENNDEHIGEEGYGCYANNTCNSDLICENNICKQENNDEHIGEEGYDCYVNNTCNEGLICNDYNICELGSSEFDIYSLNQELYVGKTTISNNNCRWDTTNFFGAYHTIDETIRMFSEMNIFNTPTSDITIDMKVCYDSYCTTGGFNFELNKENYSDSEIILTLKASNSTDMRDYDVTPDEDPFDCQLQEEIEYKFTYTDEISGKLDIHYDLVHSGPECQKLKFPEDCTADGYSVIDDSHQYIEEYGKVCSYDDDCSDNLICGNDDTCTDEEGYKKNSVVKTTPLTLK